MPFVEHKRNLYNQLSIHCLCTIKTLLPYSNTAAALITAMKLLHVEHISAVE